MAKKTKKTPLLTAAEKTTLREARKILKRLTRKWEKLEDEAAENEGCIIDYISAAADEFLAELEPLHIDFDGCTAVIDLEN